MAQNEQNTNTMTIQFPQLERTVSRELKRVAAAEAYAAARTQTNSLRNALYNVLNDPKFYQDHSAEQTAKLITKIDTALRAQQTATDALQRQQQRRDNDQWGLGTMFNPLRWKSVWDEVTSEQHDTFINRAARALQGGLSSEQRSVSKIITPELKQTINDTVSQANDIVAQYGANGVADIDRPRRLIKDDKDKKDSKTTDEQLQNIVDSVDRLTSQIVKFLAPQQRYVTYSLEDKQESVARETQSITTVQQLADNVKKITNIVANAPILKSDTKTTDDSSLLSAAMGGSGLLASGLAGLTGAVSLASSIGSKLLSVGFVPLVKAVTAVVPLITKLLTLKGLASAVSGAVSSISRRKTRLSTTVPNSKPPVVKPVNEPLTTKPIPDVPKQTTVPQTIANKPAAQNTTAPVNKLPTPTNDASTLAPKQSVKDTTKLTVGSATNTIKSAATSTIGKIGGVAAAGLSLASGALSIADNNAAIDQQVASGQLTEQQGSDLKTKQGTEIALKSGAIGAGAWIGGVLGSVGGPIGTMLGATIGQYAANALTESEIGSSVVSGIADGVTALKKKVQWLFGGDKDKDDSIKPTQQPPIDQPVKPNNQTTDLSVNEVNPQVLPIKQNKTEAQVAETAFRQNAQQPNTNLNNNTSVNQVNNYQSNSEVVYNGMSATDNLGYTRLISDPRIVGIPNY